MNYKVGVGHCKVPHCPGEVDKTEVTTSSGKKSSLEGPGMMTCRHCGTLHYFHFTYDIVPITSEQEVAIWEAMNLPQKMLPAAKLPFDFNP